MPFRAQRHFVLLAVLGLLASAPSLKADDLGLPEIPGQPGMPALPEIPGQPGMPALPVIPGQPGMPPIPQESSVPPSTSVQTPSVAQLQTQLKDLLAQEQSIDKSENALDRAIDRVMKATGLHLGGEAVVQSEDMLVLPNDPLGMYSKNTQGLPTQFNTGGATGAQRIWPTIGYFDLDITARPTSDISAEVVYRMEKVFGDFWGQGDLAGVRWFNLHGDTPVGFDVGMFYFQETPLTFWVPQDEYAFEPEVLAMKRDEGRADALIQGQSFPLEGARSGTTLLLFNHLDMDLDVLGVRTAVAGNPNTALPFGVTFPYDQYLFGGEAHFTGDHDKAFTLGFSYFNTQESVDTALVPSPIPPQYSEIMDSDFKLSMAGGKVVLHGEGAYSEYNPAYGTPDVVSWTQGGAGNVFLDVNTSHNKLTLGGIYVDQQYVNYAAQTRDEDTSTNFAGFMPTGNNLFDPYTGAYGLPNQTNLYFGTYNNVIFGTNQGPRGGMVLSHGSQPGGIYLPPSPLNLSTPEGFATPDREGVNGDYKGSFFGTGFLQPRIFGSYYTEPEVQYDEPAQAGRNSYTKGGAGGSMDFAALGLLPLKITAGVVTENTQGQQYVSFTSTRLAYDMDYQALKGVHVMVGFEHVDLNGGNFWDYGNGPVYEWQNYTYDNYVAGVKWEISKATTAFLTYSFDQFQNIDYGNGALAAVQPALDIYSASTQTQEFEAKLAVGF